MTYLFAYGQLQHDIDPPKTMKSWKVDYAIGMMYDLGKDVAMIFTRPKTNIYCVGELLTIDEKELKDLDNDERHADYERYQIVTASGAMAWAYEYEKPIPKSAPRIWRWHKKGTGD